jgi:DNA-binding NarL/FixJ family response regulator
MQILQMKADGLSNKEIALKLSISEQTVKNHVSAMLNKLGVRNSISAVVWGIKNKVING